MQKTKKTGLRKPGNSKNEHAIEKQFIEISGIILDGRQKAYSSVNAALIETYWRVGQYINQKIASTEWGDGVVRQLAEFLQKSLPDPRGFSDKNLWRMRQFNELYSDYKILSTLLRELPWSSHLLIISKTSSQAEREFYLHTAIRERYTVRELEQAIQRSLFERTVITPLKVSDAVQILHPAFESVFRDSYSLDFLGLHGGHNEADLRKGITGSLKRFILEFGRDFAFIGEEYRLQVGMKDFFIDLLFFHRELQCLVAFELKVDEFKPEYMGKLSFYLEALDRDVKKTHEKPSIGIILCKGRDTEVVEYALARTASPAVIAEYTTILPDKKLLQSKLHEFFESTVREMQVEYRSIGDPDL